MNENDLVYIQYIFLLITSVLIIIINYFFYSYFDEPNIIYISLLFTLFFPFFLNLYSIFWHINYQTSHTNEEIIEKIQNENNLELGSKIPIILFGLALFITKLQKKYISLILPYLLFSLILGTILPEIFITLIFDHSNIMRLSLVQEINFALTRLSYGFLIMSVVLTLLVHFI
jgi:hypothetical protein